MSAASAANILIAASEVDARLLECLADCRATLVRTYEEAQRALREHWFRMIVIDLNFDDVRMFDLLQHVRSLSAFNAVPVLCVQGTEAGAGIGAALDRLVRKLGGKAFVDLRRDDQVLRLCDLVGADSGVEKASRTRLCILIIDHDVDAAHRLGEILEQAGHDVDFAYHGAAGLEAARQLRPDVVFLDLALPRSDAYQLARRLRREAGVQEILIIALGCGTEEERRLLEESEFDHQLGKHPDRESVGKALNARRDKKYKLPTKNGVRS